MFCWAYQDDIDQAYAFYCARYENITYEDFLGLGYHEFYKKLNSIPETEPLYKIIKSRTINISAIKNKNEQKYWSDLRRINQIPAVYLSRREINAKLEKFTKGGKNGNRKFL